MVGITLKHRSPGGNAGAPSALLTGELAYNMVDGYFYVGYGDDGSGNATSIKLVAKDDFNVAQRVPTGGTSGQVLARDGSGNAVWVAPPSGGSTYSAGTGLTLTSTVFAVDETVIATVASVNSGLAGKANTVHTHDAADVVSGVFALARIPSLPASQITSGVLDVARIPVLPSQTVQVSSGDLTALTTAQQNAIAAGTVVTTIDGNRYVYTGTGSKTASASYIQLADITPDWSVIANKPSFATVATSGAYADLSGKPSLATVATTGAYSDLTGVPTLGTMAAQNAASVAITGGTISGVTINGGTF